MVHTAAFLELRCRLDNHVHCVVVVLFDNLMLRSLRGVIVVRKIVERIIVERKIVVRKTVERKIVERKIVVRCRHAGAKVE